MKDLLEKFMARFFSNEESIFFGLLLLFCSVFILLFGNILLPVFLSIVIAFLLNGLLRSFESLKISPTISLSLTLIIFFGFYLSILYYFTLSWVSNKFFATEFTYNHSGLSRYFGGACSDLW